jgi:hypothetical protein
MIQGIITYSDERLQDMWDELTDVPFDEDYETQELYLEDRWKHFEAGTWREDIWHWFDAHHSKGVAHLLGLSE